MRTKYFFFFNKIFNKFKFFFVLFVSLFRCTLVFKRRQTFTLLSDLTRLFLFIYFLLCLHQRQKCHLIFNLERRLFHFPFSLFFFFLNVLSYRNSLEYTAETFYNEYTRQEEKNNYSSDF